MINLYWIASIWRQNDLKWWVTSQTIQNRWTTKVINLYWLASIWRQNEQKWWVTSQNIQNYAKLQKWSTYTELHRFDVKTSKNDELRRKTFKTTQDYESDQIIIFASIWRQNDLQWWVTSQTIQNRWTTKVINLYWLASIWRQNEQKWWVTSQNIQNYAKLRKWSNYNICIDLTSKRSTMMSYVAKHSKLRKTTKVIKL